MGEAKRKRGSRLGKEAATAADKSVQITLKVDPRVIDRADQLLETVANETGLQASRADVFRIALVRGLQSLERDKSRG